MNRILTTHVGSLPRPHDLLDMMKARLGGEVYDEAAYDARVRNAVFETVAKQLECGIDIVADGEQSKPGFFTYVRERLSGFEPRPGMKVPFYEAEVSTFPEYYKEYFARAMGGGAVAPLVPTVCIGPVSYIGREALARDIQNLKDALVGQNIAGAFMPSVAPSGAGLNEHYRTDEEYYHAVGSALREEYKAIVEAGFYLQIDDPFLSDVYSDLRYDDAQKERKAGLFVEALNHALNGLPDEMVRFHTCYGINEGPRIFDARLKDVVGHMLKVKARFYSFEGANARHEHEYHVWESVRLPAGKVFDPRRHHARQQHRRAPGAHCRATCSLCQDRRRRQRHRQHRLRLLLAGLLQDRGPSQSDLGEIQGIGRGRPAREQADLGAAN